MTQDDIKEVIQSAIIEFLLMKKPAFTLQDHIYYKLNVRLMLKDHIIARG